MLGFIVALEAETPNINNYFANAKKISINGFNGYLFDILKHNTVLIFSGVGKANAAAATMSLINNFSVSAVINIGSAGSLNIKLAPGSFFIPTNAQYVDVDATAFGYKLNQVPHENESFSLCDKLSLICQQIIKEYQSNFVSGDIGTSDAFINRNNSKNFNLQEVIAVDMESTAIAQICQKNNVECTCIKYISDCIYADEISEKQWSNNINENNKLMSEIIYNVACKYIYQFELDK